jgi:hypothetical protein
VLAGELEAHDDGSPFEHALASGRDLLLSRRWVTERTEEVPG